MKNEKLMRAIGEIDEDLILEAREVRRTRPKWIRWSALAACLTLVMLCAPVLITVFGGAHGADPEHEAVSPETDERETALEVPDKVLEDVTNQIMTPDVDKIAELQKQLEEQKAALEAQKAAAEAAKAAADEAKAAAEAAQAASDSANAALLQQIQELLKAQEAAKDDTSSETSDEGSSYMIPVNSVVNFILEKKVDAPVSIIVRVRNVGGINGEWELSTERGMSDWVIIWVDGERVAELPSEAGTYEVSMDCSALLASEAFTVTENFEIISEKEFIIR